MKRIIYSIAIIIVLFVFICQAIAQPQSTVALSSGETIYVPIYSKIISGPKAREFQLSAMLSLRNTDPNHAITINKADYYDSTGKLIEKYLKEPLVLKPMASEYIFVNQYDTKGGEGANFLVQWQSAQKVNQPIIEGLMLSLYHGQGVSFRCPGQIITEHAK